MLILTCALTTAGVHEMAAQSLELFGGFKFANMRPEQDYNSVTMNGWNASATLYPTHRVGLTADFAGYYGTAQAPVSIVPSQPDVTVRQYSFMGGPQIRLIHKGAFETSVKALFGAARGYLPDVPTSVTASSNYTYDETKFAALFGSNIDLNVSRRVALRFSPGIYITQFGQNYTQKSFTFSVGPVFKFGGGEN
jgi:hypothetical protein